MNERVIKLFTMLCFLMSITNIALAQDVEKTVKELINKRKRISEDKILLSSSLKEDLKFDVFDYVEFMIDLEDKFHISIPDSDPDKWGTVKDVVAYVNGRLAKSESPKKEVSDAGSDTKTSKEVSKEGKTSKGEALTTKDIISLAISTLGLIGILVSFVSAIIILIAAFKTSVGQGFLCLCIPVYILYFAFAKYKSSRKGLVLSLWIGGPIFAVIMNIIANII